MPRIWLCVVIVSAVAMNVNVVVSVKFGIFVCGRMAVVLLGSPRISIHTVCSVIRRGRTATILLPL